jgi:hypothetical protein
LKYITDKFGNPPLRDLLNDVVSQTRPMLDVQKRGQRLRMDLVNNEERIPGMELEKVIQGMEQIERGEGRTLGEVMAELRR